MLSSPGSAMASIWRRAARPTLSVPGVLSHRSLLCRGHSDSAVLTPRPSQRGSRCDPFYVMQVMKQAAAREAEGKRVLHMEVGQPSTGAPQPVIEAARRALARSEVGSDLLGYTSESGILPLRAGIAQHYQDMYSVNVDPENVVVTKGSSGAFVLAFLACFDAGDKVALAVPGYPCYMNILQALGVEVIPIETDVSTNFQPTPQLLDEVEKKHGKLRGVMVASPGNPTGCMLSPGELASLTSWADARGAWLISDEIYHGITYGSKQQSTALQFSKNTVVINSFSKYFSMPGWRVGWMIAPPALLNSVRPLQQNLFINAPTVCQHAAVAAFDCKDTLQGHIAKYAANRELLLRELPKIGFTELAPSDGAFYIYADVSALTDDSVALCKHILSETGVACTPGIDFDKDRGKRFLRFSYSRGLDDITEAVKRLHELEL